MAFPNSNDLFSITFLTRVELEIVHTMDSVGFSNPVFTIPISLKWRHTEMCPGIRTSTQIFGSQPKLLLYNRAFSRESSKL